MYLAIKKSRVDPVIADLRARKNVTFYERLNCDNEPFRVNNHL